MRSKEFKRYVQAKERRLRREARLSAGAEVKELGRMLDVKARYDKGGKYGA